MSLTYAVVTPARDELENITRLADYERAIGPQTAALMQVHTSNYRVSGFTKSVRPT